MPVERLEPKTTSWSGGTENVDLTIFSLLRGIKNSNQKLESKTRIKIMFSV